MKPVSSRRAFPFKRRELPLAAALVLGALQVQPVLAQDDEAVVLDDVTVTATRRATGLQETPINITAVSGDTIQQQKVEDLSDYVKLTPGLYIVDQGGRDANLLTVRGLSVSNLGASEGVGPSGGGVVAQYFGDVPMYVDLLLFDMDRIEALLGPQGTLYGAGSLGGAIRYIPKAPQPGVNSLEVSGGGYSLNHSDSLGKETQAIANLSLGPRAAVRLGVNYLDDPGFIDYDYVVREIGVSDPEPQLDDPAAVEANLRQVKDANDYQRLAVRGSVLANLTDDVSAKLSYMYQDQDSGGRTVNHKESFGTGDYVSAQRVLEPNQRTTELASLEVNADFGFATLTSATGFTDYNEDGQRDQTDLLLSFQYGYEMFPTFTAYTHETLDQNRFSQELRLVSNDEGRFDWIVGGFYNNLDTYATSSEFVPGIPEFFGVDRPDNLEYYQPTFDHFSERAAFGELGYDLTEKWHVTVGGRFFKFSDEATSGFALPLIDGSAPDQIRVVSDTAEVSDSGSIFKFNTSYQFSKGLLGYATVSEGYRVGGSNPVPACQDPLPPGQNVCALPDELLIKPDKTRNYELGVHSAFFKGRVQFNGAIYYIDWKDVQVSGATVNGSIPIVVNGAAAATKGAELSGRATLNPYWSVMASFSYNQAELTEDAPGIVSGVDAQDGDRLPGSPESMGRASVMFSYPFSNGYRFESIYSVYAQGDVYTRTGLRNGGEALGGYAVHDASASIGTDRWNVRLYAKNFLDRYAETGVRNSYRSIGAIDPSGDTDNGDGFRLRSYYKSVLDPARFGVTLTYHFGDIEG
jgi:outer membrane receptor protein involved in Fe transport